MEDEAERILYKALLVWASFLLYLKLQFDFHWGLMLRLCSLNLSMSLVWCLVLYIFIDDLQKTFIHAIFSVDINRETLFYLQQVWIYPNLRSAPKLEHFF